MMELRLEMRQRWSATVAGVERPYGDAPLRAQWRYDANRKRRRK